MYMYVKNISNLFVTQISFLDKFHNNGTAGTIQVLIERRISLK